MTAEAATTPQRRGLRDTMTTLSSPLDRAIRARPPCAGPASTAHAVTTGGMAGWQITLIASGAAPVAAAA